MNWAATKPNVPAFQETGILFRCFIRETIPVTYVGADLRVRPGSQAMAEHRLYTSIEFVASHLGPDVKEKPYVHRISVESNDHRRRDRASPCPNLSEDSHPPPKAGRDPYDNFL